MKMNELVSVIVPIYGVQDYLKKCLDSIIGQTYRNLEIILVDDGSPDACPEICDEYAKKDSRIKVIHKKNGGLSDARNAGIDIANGEYYVFIDSDDWVESTMVKHLIDTCKKYGTAIAACGRYVTDGNITKCTAYESSEKLYSAEEALDEILAGKSLDVAAWDKIYAKNLFATIRYPVGENNEDIAVFYKIVDAAGKVAHCGTNEYYYRNRPGSITKLKYSIDARKIIEKNLKSIELFVAEKYQKCTNSYKRYKAVNLYALLNKYIKCKGTEKVPEYEYLMSEFRFYKRDFFRDKQIPVKEKMIAMMILLHIYDPYLRVKERIKGYK